MYYYTSNLIPTFVSVAQHLNVIFRLRRKITKVFNARVGAGLPASGGFTRPLLGANKFAPTRNDKKNSCATDTFVRMTYKPISMLYYILYGLPENGEEP